MIQQPSMEYEPMYLDENLKRPAVVIPAMSWTANNGGVEWMRSFGGGMQLLFNEGGEVVYDLNSTSFGIEKGRYKFKMQLSSVHSNDPVPFKLAVSSSVPGVEPAVYEIPFLYTFGLWESTKSIEVELGGGMETLELSRNGECKSVSIKQFTITL